MFRQIFLHLWLGLNFKRKCIVIYFVATALSSPAHQSPHIIPTSPTIGIIYGIFCLTGLPPSGTSCSPSSPYSPPLLSSYGMGSSELSKGDASKRTTRSKGKENTKASPAQTRSKSLAKGGKPVPVAQNAEHMLEGKDAIKTTSSLNKGVSGKVGSAAPRTFTGLRSQQPFVVKKKAHVPNSNRSSPGSGKREVTHIQLERDGAEQGFSKKVASGAEGSNPVTSGKRKPMPTVTSRSINMQRTVTQISAKSRRIPADASAGRQPPTEDNSKAPLHRQQYRDQIAVAVAEAEAESSDSYSSDSSDQENDSEDTGSEDSSSEGTEEATRRLSSYKARKPLVTGKHPTRGFQAKPAGINASRQPSSKAILIGKRLPSTYSRANSKERNIVSPEENSQRTSRLKSSEGKAYVATKRNPQRLTTISRNRKGVSERNESGQKEHVGSVSDDCDSDELVNSSRSDGSTASKKQETVPPEAEESSEPSDSEEDESLEVEICEEAIEEDENSSGVEAHESEAKKVYFEATENPSRSDRTVNSAGKRAAGANVQQKSDELQPNRATNVRLATTACDRAYKQGDDTAFVNAVKEEFFYTVEHGIELENELRYLRKSRNPRAQATIYIKTKCLDNHFDALSSTLIPKRLQELQNLGLEMEARNYKNWGKMVRLKEFALRRNMDKEWSCDVDRLQKVTKSIIDLFNPREQDPAGEAVQIREAIVTTHKVCTDLKEVLGMLNEVITELLWVHKEDGGCQVQ